MRVPVVRKIDTGLPTRNFFAAPSAETDICTLPSGDWRLFGVKNYVIAICAEYAKFLEQPNPMTEGGTVRSYSGNCIAVLVYMA